ncbi:MAG: hypothetical protein EOP02_04590 [Proteobacteria bacterium]|nr:MAG: hypothetical protein EOP02_04590 [Pseudomonadota bacterium]
MNRVIELCRDLGTAAVGASLALYIVGQFFNMMDQLGSAALVCLVAGCLVKGIAESMLNKRRAKA